MATWKKLHVEDANTVHGTITATLGDNSTDGAAGSVELVMVGGTGEQELRRQTYNFGANAFNSTTIPAAANDTEITFALGTGGTGGGSITLNQGSTETIAFNVVGGGGITAGASDISVTVDDSTIELSDGTANASVQLKDDGIKEPKLHATNTATDGYILSYDSTSTGFTWVANTAAANDTTITLTAGAGLAAIGDGSFTLNQSGAETFTFAVDGVLEDLDTLGAASSDGEFIVATGAGAFAYESGNTARTSLGLGTGDNVQFTNLTLTGDLTVQGDVTSIETTNLEVTDQFILLNNAESGSETDADAGIVVEGSTKNVAYGYDQSADRWGFMDADGATSGMTSLSPDHYAVGVHTNTAVPTDGTNGANTDLQVYGNMYVQTNGDIYIYS